MRLKGWFKEFKDCLSFLRHVKALMDVVVVITYYAVMLVSVRSHKIKVAVFP